MTSLSSRRFLKTAAAGVRRSLCSPSRERRRPAGSSGPTIPSALAWLESAVVARAYRRFLGMDKVQVSHLIDPDCSRVTRRQSR